VRLHCLPVCLAIALHWTAMALVMRSTPAQQVSSRRHRPCAQLLTPLVDVIPAGGPANAEEMTNRDRHVATAVNGQVSPGSFPVINGRMKP
jgi:hypothetical protein